MTKKVRKAVIPAAGLGTRFLPATKALAKEMLPIVDKPTLQFIFEEVHLPASQALGYKARFQHDLSKDQSR